MTRTPTVSICIPVRNGLPYLRHALTTALGQEGIDHEVIVRDSGSTDGTKEYLHGVVHPRLRVEMSEGPESLPENFRAVTEMARAGLIKVLCADDLIRSDACARQAAWFADSSVALVASRRDIVDDNSRVLLARQGLRGLRGRRTGAQVLRRVILCGYNPIGEPGGVMFRRADYDSVGGWDGRRTYPMDLDLWLKLIRHGDLIGQPESLAAFRLTPGSISGNRRASQFAEHVELVHEVVHDERWAVPGWQRHAADISSRAMWALWSVRQRRMLRPD